MTALEKASLNTSVSNRVKLDDKSGAQVHHLLGSPNSLLEGPANPVCTLLTDLKAPQTRTTADRGPRRQDLVELHALCHRQGGNAAGLRWFGAQV